MSKTYKNSDDIKRKLREIKKFEIKLRSNNLYSNNLYMQKNINKSSASSRGSSRIELVWNKFFDLKNSFNKDVKYTIDELSLMTKEEFLDIIEEYFYHVYYWYYKERGIADNSLIDIDILTELGLPMDSNYDDVIKAFRDHVKAYHPDNGGDVSKFLKVMESYNKFRADM
ncbi:MAG: J domain-containing protein [Anaerolineaceae bacterium]|nr:MAG: J domain-containing protein [Anaerolineaceae bacterium]